VPHNFTGLDPSADGSGNCSALLGAACAYDVGNAALKWGLGTRPGRPVFNIPGSCNSIHTGTTSSAGGGGLCAYFNYFPSPSVSVILNENPVFAKARYSCVSA
jgi:hypothetical protein